MSRVNAHVNGELERLEAEWDAGVDEGYSANPNQLPEFFHKPYINLTRRQRGYIFGRELRLQELQEKRNA